MIIIDIIYMGVKRMLLKENDVVLFQGDSITDWGRDRNDPNSLGHGYASIVAAMLSFKYPELKLKFLNRGIGGNRAIDLKNRWQEDCLDLKPTVVSLMIGINDTWRKFDENDATTTEEYKATVRELLTDVKEKLGARIVIMEPFVVPYPEDRKAWREDLDPRIHAVRELAAEFDAVMVPLDGLFNSAAINVNGPEYWTIDGVHPSEAGFGLISQAWMDAVEKNRK